MLNLSFKRFRIILLQRLLTILIAVNIFIVSISPAVVSVLRPGIQSTELIICTRERQHVSWLSYLGIIKKIKGTKTDLSSITFSFKYFLLAVNHRLHIQFYENLRLAKVLARLKKDLFYNTHIGSRMYIPSIIS